MSHFKTVKIQHISRCQNEHANRLVQLASDDKNVMDNWLLTSKPNQPSMENEPAVHVCANEPEDDWRTPIIEFLKMGVLPSSRGEA